MPEPLTPESAGPPSSAVPDSPPSRASGLPPGTVAPREEAEAHHRFVQAPVRALDEDGINVAVIGTVVFALATLILAWQLPALHTRHAAWWVWVGVAGTVQGLLGLWYCVRRKALRLAGRMV